MGHSYKQPIVHASTGEITRDFMPAVSDQARILLYRLPHDWFIHYDGDDKPELPNLWIEAGIEEYRDYPSHEVTIGKRGRAKVSRVY